MNPTDFLDIVSPNKDDPTVFKIGTIPNTYTTGRPTILFDGESIASTRTYPCLSSYVPSANDRVVLALVGHVFTVIGKIDSGLSPWIALPLSNGWVNYGSGWADAGYYKDSLGIVRVRGMIKNGTTAGGTIISNLPAGYRPALNTMIPLFSFNGSAAVMSAMEIYVGGQVSISTPAVGNSWMTLESIQFRAEQ